MARPVARRVVAAGACLTALVVAVALRSAGVTDAAPTIPLDPIAHWVFTPDTVTGGTVADRAGKLPGTVTGTPKVVADGLTARIEFAGPNDGITIKDKLLATDPVLPKEAFSIVTWARIDQPNEWGGLFGCFQDNGPAEAGVVLGFSKSTFAFGLATTGADDGDGKITYLEGTTKYELGRWYHVAATYDGKTMRLYVNGVLDGQSTEQRGPVLYAASAPLVIGRYKDADEDYPMQGAIREVLWCGHAVPAERVAEHFRANQALAAAKPAGETGPQFVIAPYLQYPTRTGITVMCETDVPTTCIIEYGTKFPPDNIVEDKVAGTMHELPIAGLQPKTKYNYRVTCTAADGSKIVSKPLTLFTAVDATDAYSFAVIGDTQKNPVITGKVAKLMWERRPNFVVHLGDVVDNGPDKKEWTDELFKPCQELFGRVACFPCIGNHEKNHAHYYKYFSLPKPEYYYSYRYGNAEFFSIDTNKSVLPESEQYIWLDKALAASDAKWKICYHHHPCYSSDSDDYGDTWKGTTTFGALKHKPLIGLYEKHRVDLVMNGHIHLYERTFPIRENRVDPKGVVYLTSGGGGGRLEDFDPAPAFFKNQGRVDYHFCYFTVHAGGLECKAFDHEGRLFDSWGLTK